MKSIEGFVLTIASLPVSFPPNVLAKFVAVIKKAYLQLSVQKDTYR